MGSRKVLLSLTVVAAALAVATILDRSRQPRAAVDWRVLPELVSAEVTALRWMGSDSFALERRDRGWVLVRAGGADDEDLAPRIADPAAVDRLLAGLEFLRFERRVEADDGAEPARVLRLEFRGREPIELGLASGTGPAWLSRGRWRFLVRDADASLIAPGAAQLRQLRSTDVFDFDAAELTAVDLVTGSNLVVVSGRPFVVGVESFPGSVRADAQRARELVDRLGSLRADRFAARSPTGEPRLRVRVVAGTSEQRLEVFGDCGDGPGADTGAGAGRLANSRLGAVCLPEAAVAPVEALASDPARLFDRRPFSIPPFRALAVRVDGRGGEVIARRQGAVWTLDAGGRGMEAEARAVDQWLQQSQQWFGDLQPEPPAAADTIAEIEVTGVDSSERLTVFQTADGSRWAQRGREKVVFALTAAAPQPLFAPWRLRSRQVLALEPTAIRAITRTHGGTRQRVVRGELHTDWRGDDGAAVVADAVVATRDALAGLRASEYVSPGTKKPESGWRYQIELDPPPTGGPGQVVAVELSKVAAGCRARADGGDWFVLDETRCAALIAPW